jgi:excisionase family DNA binding protein
MGSTQATKKENWKSSNNEMISVGTASRLLGVSPATVRRWSDTRQIPSYRLEAGRKDRRFRAEEIQQLIVGSGLESDNSSG